MKDDKLSRIAIAQINPKLGYFDYNKKLIIRYLDIAKINSRIDLLIFPELCICGYGPGDLAFRDDFCEMSYNVVQELVSLSINYDFGFIVGAIKPEEGKRYNSAFFIYKGEILLEHKKKELPNYGVFDELRIYDSGPDKFGSVSFRGLNFSILICEDLWSGENYGSVCSDFYNSRNSSSNRQTRQTYRQLDLVIVINASPFWIGKHRERIDVIQKQIKKYNVPLLYVNMVGGQDELVYDGGSMYFDSSSEIKFQADFFKEGFYVIDDNSDSKYFDLNDESTLDSLGVLTNRKSIDIVNNNHVANNYSLTNGKLSDDDCENVYTALTLGLSDYVKKNNFSSVTIGYSSGIDSTLVALIAIDSFGINNVNLLSLPSIYTSDETFKDSRYFFELVKFKNHKEISINNIYDAFIKELDFIESDRFKKKGTDDTGDMGDTDDDIALQNLQSRIRGNVLMYFANKNNSLLLTTGNKSEIAVGYCTLYGDTNGAFNPIKDLYKTQVYEIAGWRNKNFTQSSMLKKINVIPENILNKNPSAELRFNQKDSDSIPEYSILDKILELYIDNRKSIKEITEMGFDYKIVETVANMIRISQFKRSQSAIGTKISNMSFGLDFRYPITNGFM